MKDYITQFNALRITVDGAVEPIWIEDFSSEASLCEVISPDCEEIDCLFDNPALEFISNGVGYPVAGFLDACGWDHNPLLQSITESDSCMGNGVLCGCDDLGFAPLETHQVEHLVRVLPVLAVIPSKTVVAALDCFRVVGQDLLDRGNDLYSQGRLEEAHECFRESAMRGCPNGMNAVAIDNIFGEGVAQNVALGLEMMEVAAEAGSVKAWSNLGVYYMEGLHGLPKDPEQAQQYLEAAATHYNASAMACLGYLYTLPEYGFCSYAKAAYWLQNAIELEDTDAWLFLAVLMIVDDYYSYQPAFVRYCLEKYAEATDISLEEAMAEAGCTAGETDEILEANSVEPWLPRVPNTVILDGAPNPSELYAEAMELLSDEDTAQEGMELLLKAADMGYTPACSYAGTAFLDQGQEDFLFDEDGAVTNFPGDDSKAQYYMMKAATGGDKHSLRFLPFVFDDMPLEYAKAHLARYTAITGDWVMEALVAPVLDKVLAGDEALPWTYPEDFFGREELYTEATEYYRESTSDTPGVDIVFGMLELLKTQHSPIPETKKAIAVMEENLAYLGRLME